MAITTIDYNYTYPGQLPLTPVEIQPVVEAAPLLALMPKVTGVKDGGIRLQKLLRPSKMVVADDGCSDTFGSSDITYTDVFLKPEPMKIQLQECYDVYNEEVLEQLTRDGQDQSNLIGTQLWSNTLNLINTQIGRDVASMISFGKTTDADGNWNVFDGLVTKMLEDSYCSTSIETITGTMSAQEAVDLLKKAYDECPLVLQSRPASQKAFLVTPNVYQRYQAYVEGISAAQLFVQPWSMVQAGGAESLMFRGVPVIRIDQWQEDLADVTNPYYGTYNALVIYTDIQNHRIGTDTLNGFGSVRGWYDIDSDTNRLRWRGKIGYNFIHCELNAYAFGNIS